MEILTNQSGDLLGSFRVTDITPSASSENRVNIFLNGKFSFSLDLSQVIDFKIKVGKRLTNDEVEKLKRASSFGLLYQRTLEWALTRPHSIREARDYLRRRQIRRDLDNRRRLANAEKPIETRRALKLPTRQLAPILSEDIEAVIERLIEKGYLDDEKFTRYYVENRNQKKGISILKLRQELSKKGIKKEMVDLVLAEQPRDEKEEIMKIISKKREKYNDHKLVQYLLRRGFRYDLIKEVLEI